MPSTRKMILSHVMNGLFVKMNRTKQVPSDVMETPLNRCLNTFDITLLGIGHMVGAGIYVLTGTVAREIAGPGIILSFLLAGLTSLLAALCYAEFGTRIPKAGSAYVYTYVSVGEFWAFVIGWNIILEHMIGAASVARAWSGYVDSLFGGEISNITISITGEMHEELLGKYPDLLAGIVCVVYALLLGLGVKISTIVNSLLTLINLVVVILVICVGFYYANEDNWTLPGEGFLPFGFGGVVAGAATCFYAFVGFDSIATSGEEAKNPSFSIPMATVLSMGVVTVGYILVSAAVTLMVPFNEINPNAALPDAFSSIGLHWIKYIVSIGALCGMSSTLFGSLFSLPRCMYSMATDGLLFSFLGSVNAKTQVPVVNLIISGICSGIIAILFDLEKLVEFMSIGTLLAYTIVSASVIILRYTPDRQPVLTPGSEMSQSTSEADVDVGVGVGAGVGADVDQSNVSAGLLKPQYLWLRPIVGNTKPGCFVAVAVSIFVICGCGICIVAQYIVVGARTQIVYHVIVAVVLIVIMISCLLLIAAHQQNLTGLRFHVPFVPFVPALSIFFNLQLMFHLNVLTWIRFFVWMAVGMLVYFLYGIHNSREGDSSSTYSILMTSSEAGKEKWGSTTRGTFKGALTVRKSSSTEKRPIIDEEEGQ